MFNIKTDSRKVVKGDTFVALKEFSSDGHDYIEKAIENGATKIICERGIYSVETIVVGDTHEYIKNYLKETYAYLFNKIKLIGITGTNGKTTTAYMLHTALNLLNKKAAYIGTIGFYMQTKIKDLSNTTPYLCDLYELFYEAYEKGCDYVVMEVSSQGIAHNRIEGLEFDCVIFTNLTQDHLDYHKTMENYVLEKQKLFKQVKKNGIKLINSDDEYKNYFEIEPFKTYGFTESDYQIKDYYFHNATVIKINNTILKTKLIGKFNVYNISSIFGLLIEMGFDNKDIVPAILKTQAPSGRMETIDYNNSKIIVDYAHTPDAMEKVINSIKDDFKGNKITVFGCTGDRDKTKRPIMFDIACKLTDHVIVTIDDLHHEDADQIIADMIKDTQHKNYDIQLDRKKAIIKGIDSLKDNGILFVLGKGHETSIIIKDKKVPFNDKEVILEYINSKITN